MAEVPHGVQHPAAAKPIGQGANALAQPGAYARFYLIAMPLITT
jgi:hypothetical protein